MGRGGGARPVNVTVHNDGSDEARVETRRGPGGTEDIEVIIGNIVDDKIGKGGFDGTMKGRFGLGPQTTRR